MRPGIIVPQIILILSGLAYSHPGPHAEISKSEINRRSELSKRCAPAVAQLNEKRYNRRNLEKRWKDNATSTYKITTEAPYYQVIQNDTCVLATETTRGPYFRPPAQQLRQDITEGEPGVPVWLDIGVMDMATCEPLSNALVSLWHCNATGHYSSFSEYDPAVTFGDLLGQLNVTNYTMGVTDLSTDNSTYLRGMWPTDSEGMMEMKSIFPGYYAQRTNHIHLQVYTNWVLNRNGTISSGRIVSTGQIYFPEDLALQIMQLEPYNLQQGIYRTTMEEDTIISEQQLNGYNPVMSVVPADGHNFENGIVAYGTLGVDTTDDQTDDLMLGQSIPS